MSGTTAPAPICTLFADNAAQPPATVLQDGHSIGGILEQAEAVGGGLIRVSVSGIQYLVDESLQKKLAGLMGQHMTVVRAFGQWGCGFLEEHEDWRARMGLV